MKILVEIDLGDCSRCPITPDSEWFPGEDKTLISVDEVLLTHDPQDDSFYQFKLVQLLEEGN